MSIKSTFKKITVSVLTAALAIGSMATTAFAATGSLPDANEGVSLTIHKYQTPEWNQETYPATGNEIATVPENAVPLQGVTFSIWKIAEVTEPEKVKDVSEYTITDGKLDGTTAPTDTATTDTSGIAEFGKPEQGYYLVSETDAPAAVTKGANFIVSLPMTDPTNNNSWIYDVHAYPKNDNNPETPTIDKFVTEENNKQGSFTFAEEQTWIIKSSLPATLADYTKYEITDDIDSRLTYVDNSIKVSYDAAGANAVPDTNYDATVVDGKVTVTFKSFATLKGDNDSVYVIFKTKVNEADANIGVQIPNGATVTYDYANKPASDAGSAKVPDGTDETEDKRPYVFTCGLKITKTDENDAALAGATFKIATSEDNAKAGTFIKNAAGDADLEATTGADGIIKFTGLTVGGTDSAKATFDGSQKYYLVETQAPEGYSLLSAPVEVTVNKDSFTENNTVNTAIKNYKNPSLPVTGGIGTIVFTVCGVLFMGIACVLLVTSKKKREN